MEKSKNYNFYLPSRDSDDVADINQISDNFRNIDKNIPSMQDVNKMLEAKQDTLASGINIKTINHQTILGEGNIDIENEIEVDQIYLPTSENAQSGKAVAEAIALTVEIKPSKIDLPFEYKGGNSGEYFAKLISIDKMSNTRSYLRFEFGGSTSGVYVNCPKDELVTYGLEIGKSYFIKISGEQISDKTMEIQKFSKISIDQSYNPESENAQSGKAVAEAVTTEENRADNTFANALKGSKSGSAILIDDVSPVAHDVKVTLESVNLAVPNDFVVENNGMTTTTNPDGTITVTGSVADGTQATLLQLIFRKMETEFIPLEIGQVYKIVVKKDGASILAFGTKTVYTDTGEMYWGTVETTDIMRPRKVQLVYLQKNLAEGDTSLCGTYTVQLVKGTEVGEYTPYVQVENVKLSRCGRNLIAYTDETKTVGGSGVTVIKTKNSAAFTINGTATADASIVATSPMLLSAGTYTASVDGLNTVSTNFDRCYVWDVLAGKVIVNDIMTGKPKTFTLTESTTVRIDFVFASGTSYENKVVTVQLQEGETASEWEEYNNATYTPETDGTVKGVTALSPNMTFTTDTAGVIINCEYSRDINKAFAALEAAIATNNS